MSAELGYEYTTGGPTADAERVRVLRVEAGNLDVLAEFVGGEVDAQGHGQFTAAAPAGPLAFKLGDFIVKFGDGKFLAVTEAAFKMFYRKPRRRFYT